MRIAVRTAARSTDTLVNVRWCLIMAIETYTYKPTDNPQTGVDWITIRGGRACIAGVTAMRSAAILFDSAVNVSTRLVVAGDKLTYDTVAKTFTVAKS